YADLAMQQADVIIALGARFDDRVTGEVDAFAPAVPAGKIRYMDVQWLILRASTWNCQYVISMPQNELNREYINPVKKKWNKIK
ncbi:hypothetical protein C8J57DRAFT_1083472, partial [Mycena rebaudengoi]